MNYSSKLKYLKINKGSFITTYATRPELSNSQLHRQTTFDGKSETFKRRRRKRDNCLPLNRPLQRTYLLSRMLRHAVIKWKDTIFFPFSFLFFWHNIPFAICEVAQKTPMKLFLHAYSQKPFSFAGVPQQDPYKRGFCVYTLENTMR